MPQVNVQTAKSDIYERGQLVPAETSTGYRRVRRKPADDHDRVLIPKGRIYYSWKCMYSDWQYSLTPPRPEQLTQSDYIHDIIKLRAEIKGLTVRDWPALEGIILRCKAWQQQLDRALVSLPPTLQEVRIGLVLDRRSLEIETIYKHLEKALELREWGLIPQAPFYIVQDSKGKNFFTV